MDIKGIYKNEKLRSMIGQSWSLSWPMALIMLFEFLIGMTDVYVAGKFGKDVQASYGLAFQMYFVFIIIGIALSVGVVSVTSRLFTSEKKDEFHIAVNSSIVTAGAFGLIFSIIGIIFSKNIIGLFSFPQSIKSYAASFITIYSGAFLFDYVLMTANGVLRACGMVKKSLLIMTVVCILNVALNFILPFYTPLGFKGIAAATVISISVGAVLSIFYLKRLRSGAKVSYSMIKQIFDIGWPSSLLQALWQLGSLALFFILSMLPDKNIEIMAALTNGLRIESAIFLPAFAFNMAAAVVVGNLLGKKDGPGAFRGGMVTAAMGVFIVTLITFLVMINARFIALFLSNDNIVIAESIGYIYIVLISEPIMAWGVILGGGLNGAGDTKSVMLISAFSVWAVRVPLCYILGVHYGLGAAAIWWSMNLSLLVQGVLVTRRYLGKRWMTQGAQAFYT